MTTLSYRIVGEGPALLLAHGLGVTFSIWEELLPLLKPHYKLIVVELPGNGASPACPPGENYYEASAQAIEELRQELGIEKWDLLGYSMGAWVVRAYALRWPERVQRLVFLNAAITAPFWGANLRGLSTFERISPAACNWLLRGWRLHLLVRLFGFNGANPPLAAAWTREISSQPVETVKKCLRDLPQAGRAPFTLPPAPVRFVWGDVDAVTYRPRPLRAVDRVVPGDHSAPLRSAAHQAREVIDFLGKTGDIAGQDGRQSVRRAGLPVTGGVHDA